MHCITFTLRAISSLISARCIGRALLLPWPVWWEFNIFFQLSWRGEAGRGRGRERGEGEERMCCAKLLLDTCCCWKCSLPLQPLSTWDEGLLWSSPGSHCKAPGIMPDPRPTLCARFGGTATNSKATERCLLAQRTWSSFGTFRDQLLVCNLYIQTTPPWFLPALGSSHWNTP